MPTYEYICKNKRCENAWEEEQSISDPALTACPKCKKKTASRQISAGTGFILSGGGWSKEGYSTK